MRDSIYILILTLFFLSCKENSKPERIELNNQSNFNLEDDYADLTSKMTNLDTVEISTDLSICTWQRLEKIQITKPNDSLKIVLTIEEPDYKTQHKIFKLSQGDSIWKIGNFLKNNKNRLRTTNADSYPRMIIFNKVDTLKYYTEGLIDINNFIGDYYKMMHEIDTTNELYDFVVTTDFIN